MKTFTAILISFLLLCSTPSITQNAPVTIAGKVLNPGPTVVVPIEVTGFADIGSISLTLDYNYGITQITGISPNTNLPGFTADWTTTPGRIIMGWYGTIGVSLPDFTHIVDITFSGLITGETDLTWNNYGNSCEYAKFNGGVYTTLNDIPTGDYYINGLVKHQLDGPVTIAANVTGCSNTVTVPVKVTNFNDIGAISLKMDYDFGIVQFTGIIPHGDLDGFTANETSPGHIKMGWYGSLGVTLPDYTVILEITFTGLVAGNTPLTWIDNGISCEYAKYNNGTYTTLNDSPFNDFYKNGHITWLREGPITVAPVYTSVPDNDICIPIKVSEFTNVGAISLTMDYDPLVLEFQGITPTNIPTDWSFDGQALNPGRLHVGGLGTGFSLNDGDVLFNACFQYNVGTSTLEWYDNGGSCEYADAATLTPLCDNPQSAFYVDGLVTETLNADFIADNLTPQRNTIVSFSDLSTGNPTSWDWSFDRPAANVVYVGGTDSHSQNPQVKFMVGGPYTVTLTVHNAYLTDSEVKVAYIWVGIPGLWTGENSTDWYTASNWDDWRVPTDLTDVLIPPSPVLFWPEYLGDFTLGVQCKTITLSDITSQMTVTGDVIQP